MIVSKHWGYKSWSGDCTGLLEFYKEQIKAGKGDSHMIEAIQNSKQCATCDSIVTRGNCDKTEYGDLCSGCRIDYERNTWYFKKRIGKLSCFECLMEPFIVLFNA